MLQYLIEIALELAAEVRSTRARWMWAAAAFFLLAANICLVITGLHLIEARWALAALVGAAMAGSLFVTAILTVAAIMAEVRISQPERALSKAKGWSAVTWLILVLLVLALVPPPLLLAGVVGLMIWRGIDSTSPRRES